MSLNVNYIYLYNLFKEEKQVEELAESYYRPCRNDLRHGIIQRLSNNVFPKVGY